MCASREGGTCVSYGRGERGAHACVKGGGGGGVCMCASGKGEGSSCVLQRKGSACVHGERGAHVCVVGESWGHVCVRSAVRGRTFVRQGKGELECMRAYWKGSESAFVSRFLHSVIFID